MFARFGSVRFAILLSIWGLVDAPLVLAGGRFLTPEAGAALESGTTVRVAWSLQATADREPDEVELVLSLDGGRTFPIRVTRDLSPETLVFSWRVPSFPTTQARLALRTGESGDEEIELVTDNFLIAIGPGAPLEPTRQVAGEWRTKDAQDGESGHPLSLPSSLAGAPGTIGSAPQVPPADAPRPPLAALAGHFRGGRVATVTIQSATSLGPTLPRTPSAAPMRV